MCTRLVDHRASALPAKSSQVAASIVIILDQVLSSEPPNAIGLYPYSATERCAMLLAT